MNTNLRTEMNGIRELSADDLDSVSGGSPFLDILPVHKLDKILDSVGMSIADIITKTGTLKGVQKPK